MKQDHNKPNDILLAVENICVDYLSSSGTVHAVRNVSFTLKRGEIIGLAGESGSGKSTLAYAISRLLRPPAQTTGGKVFYYPARLDKNELPASITKIPEGQQSSKQSNELEEQRRIDILQLSPAQLRAFRWNELAIVFQSAMNALNPVMDIGTQIMDVLKAHRPEQDRRARQQRARELLGMVGIAPDRLRSYPHELSGGMRQRAVIAIALALQPELIIMDEPTTALDVVVQREILELISSLCKETGTSLIFITHDLSLLLELADEVAIMYGGQLIERGTQQEIYEHPRHPYTYGLMNSFPTIYGPRRLMSGIPGSPPDLRTIPTGCSFHDRCPFAFSPCQSVIPVLQQATKEDDKQLVACHLYNPDVMESESIPDTTLFAQGYQLHQEESISQ